MSARVRIGALMAALACGCGAGADPGKGGGFTDLPSRGAGPYGKLAPDTETPLAEPVVLSDPTRQLDYYAPAARASGDGIFTLYYSAGDGASAEIQRVTGVDLVELVDPGPTVLVADQAWEASAVAHPSLVVPGISAAYGLFYQGGAGDIGYAESDDGVVFVKPPGGPVLAADLAEEGGFVGEPAAAWDGDTLWIYYAAGTPSRIFAARRLPDGTYERVDADPATAAHDPVLGANPFPEQFDSVAVATPFLRITRHAGRPVWDLWYAGEAATGRATLGFAGSFDGLVFKRYADNPLLPDVDPDERSPAVVQSPSRTVVFFSQPLPTGRLGIAAATD